MGCLSNLDKAILFTCEGGAAGIEEMLLINMADVATKSVAAGVATITLSASKKAILVESNKKGVNAVETIRQAENAPNALDQSITFTIYAKTAASANSANLILNGRFIALCKMKEDGFYRAYGVTYGLEASAMDEDANANGGFTTVTIKTPENVMGEQRATVLKTAYDTLRTGAITA